MAFKDLFFTTDSEKKTESKQPVVEPTYNSPTYVGSDKVATNPSVTITPENPACTPHVEKIMKLYEDGFNSLNLEGYDFFEFFQAVVKVGASNPAMYNMAFTMAQAMDSKVTKETLLSQSTYYIDEIEKVYKSYVDNGNIKKQDALMAKSNETSTLTKELADINSDILRLNELKVNKEGELSRIDNKYTPEITDIECKLMANEVARERIIGSIKSVVDGINRNI